MKKKGKMAACLILLVLLLAVLVVLTKKNSTADADSAVRILVQTPKKWLIFQKMM